MLRKHAVAAFLHRAAFSLFCLMPLLLVVTRAGADIGLTVIGALFLLHSFLMKDWHWLSRPDLSALAVLWFVIMAESVFTLYPAVGFGVALSWGRFIFFYAAATAWLLTSARALRTVCLIGVATLALAAIDAGWQYFTGVSLTRRPMRGDRLTGALSHPNIGNFLYKTALPMTGMAMYLAIRHGNRMHMALIGAFALGIVALVTVSGERSSMLLMLLGIGVTAGLCFLLRRKARKIALAAAVMIALLIAGLADTQAVVQQRGHFLVQQVSDFRHTPYGQLYIAAFRLWRRHPVLGIGAGEFREECSAGALRVTYCDIHPHNMYMEWLVDAGLLGLGLFVAAMAMAARRVARREMLRGHAWLPAVFACGGLSALLFPIIVTQSQFANWPGVLFWYCLSLNIGAPMIGREETRE